MKFFKNKEVFQKMFITVGILLLYRVAMLIVLPGIDIEIIPQVASKSGFLGTLNVFVGGGIDRCSILATNIMPYITSSILIQIFSSRSIGLDYFKNLKKDRELGNAKLNEWTQYITFFVSLVNAIYISNVMLNTFIDGKSIVCITSGLFYLIAIPSLVAGSFFVIWLANQVSKFGIGQGTSVIIFANVVSNSVSSASKIYELFKAGEITIDIVIGVFLFFICIFCFVIFIEGCNRFISIKYAGITGKNALQKLPLKINNAGVLTPVLASSFAHFPQVLIGFLNQIFYTENLNRYFSYIAYGGPLYYVFSVFFLFILAITQSELVFDPNEVALNLQESGAIILGVRPGPDTVIYLQKLLRKLNFLSAIYLIFVCILPEYFCKIINNYVGNNILQLSGTTILILVSTAQLIFNGFLSYNYKKELSKMTPGEV